MIIQYKSAVYQFDESIGLTTQVVESLDKWLNTWLQNGYVIDKMSEITKNGNCTGFMYVFKRER